ncbi:universal stress protein [Pseudonocardia sp. CA-142604]|uniref:universal stress protein n=1 Tax=Pseudonocardia sp. CA-142604 TaxID=3240024 RepID=UPI003D8D4E20
MEVGNDTSCNVTGARGQASRNSMNYVVAYSPGNGGRAALAAARLFSSADVSLTVCTIIPEVGGHPNTSLWKSAATGLDEAKAFLGDEVNAVYITRTASSPAEGILALVAELDAGMVILGAGSGGSFRRFSTGSVTGDLLRATQVPTVLAPCGYHSEHQVRLRQIVYAYDEPRPSQPVVAAAAQLAVRHGLTQPILVTAVDGDRLGTMHWEQGEVQLIGSTPRTDAMKIMCNVPVPTVVVPVRDHASSEQRLSAYHCLTCEIEGRDLDPEPACWSCGGPTIVTSRPLLHTSGPLPDKSAVTPRSERRL